MYVVTFPGWLGCGFAVDLNLYSSRIQQLKEVTKFDDFKICASLKDFFNCLDSLSLKAELLGYIHGDNETLNAELVTFLIQLYKKVNYSHSESSTHIKSIPPKFWGITLP